LLGITGGIAAYKSCDLVRELKKSGFEVQIIMTESARRFVSSLTFEVLSGNPVCLNLWEEGVTKNSPVSHIQQARNADLILIAPASANFLAKIANGIADDLLSTVCLARNVELIVAPSMNIHMWENAATKRNIKTLQEDEVTIFLPTYGDQACGEIGLGRMMEPKDIVDTIIKHRKADKLILDNHNVLITAGPTYEPIDPVRGLMNSSTGTLGFKIAECARSFGANVDLVAGPVAHECSKKINRINVRSAREMHTETLKICKAKNISIFFCVAAIADWKPKIFSVEKLKKGVSNLNNIEWVENTDTLAAVAALPSSSKPYTVGFSAETDNPSNCLVEINKKRINKNADVIVANKVPDSFGNKEIEVFFVYSSGKHLIFKGSKDHVSKQILIEAVEQLNLET
tara:strand:+ start:115544 stop:116746 length:1203 start_codon:yes stop_codon:yes gene_type:complete